MSVRDECIPFLRIVKSWVFIYSTTNFQNILHTRRLAGHWGYSDKQVRRVPALGQTSLHGNKEEDEMR